MPTKKKTVRPKKVQTASLSIPAQIALAEDRIAGLVRSVRAANESGFDRLAGEIETLSAGKRDSTIGVQKIKLEAAEDENQKLVRQLAEMTAARDQLADAFNGKSREVVALATQRDDLQRRYDAQAEGMKTQSDAILGLQAELNEARTEVNRVYEHFPEYRADPEGLKIALRQAREIGATGSTQSEKTIRRLIDESNAMARRLYRLRWAERFVCLFRGVTEDQKATAGGHPDISPAPAGSTNHRPP